MLRIIILVIAFIGGSIAGNLLADIAELIEKKANK